MNKIHFILVAVAALLLLPGCNKDYMKDYDEREPFKENKRTFLILRNYSSDDTVWFIPDKAFSVALPAAPLDEWHKISVFEVKAHSSYELTFDSTDNYVTPVETYGPDDRMLFYVFKKDVWDSNEFPDLVSGQMWSGKCSLSVEEARELNGFVTYPMR